MNTTRKPLIGSAQTVMGTSLPYAYPMTGAALTASSAEVNVRAPYDPALLVSAFCLPRRKKEGAKSNVQYFSPGFLRPDQIEIMPGFIVTTDASDRLGENPQSPTDAMTLEIENAKLRQENSLLQMRVGVLESYTQGSGETLTSDVQLPSVEFLPTKARWTLKEEELHTWNFDDVD